MLVRWLIVTFSFFLCLQLATSDLRAACRPGFGCGSPRLVRPLTSQEKFEREQGEFGAVEANLLSSVSGSV